MIGTYMLPIPTTAKVIIEAVLLLTFIFLRRSYFFFLKGAKQLEKKNPKCWDNFKKSINAGLPDDQACYLANAFIKQGDIDYGVQLAEKISKKNPGSKEANICIVSLSMAYWTQGKLDEAIKVLEDLKKTGYQDKTLYINLCTYLLEKGDTDKAFALIKEDEAQGTLSSGMLDNKLWACLLVNDYDGAKALVDELMDERKPKFPEAYLHCAQFYLHFKRIDDALTCINSALTQKFSLNGVMGEDYLKAIADGLSNPETRLDWAYSLELCLKDVAAGKKYTISKAPETYKEEVIDIPVKVVNNKSVAKVVDDLDDDREPNTDLDDSDLEDLTTDVEVSDINTDINDDDDREPNTDVE